MSSLKPNVEDARDDFADNFRAWFSIGLLSLLGIAVIFNLASPPKKAKPEVHSAEAVRKCHLIMDELVAPGEHSSKLQKCLNIIDSSS